MLGLPLLGKKAFSCSCLINLENRNQVYSFYWRNAFVKRSRYFCSPLRFRSIPVNVLQGQYFFIDSLKIANNSIRDIPNDANILVNIKEIDISFNPLSKDSVVNMLGEPKTVHKLNMAGTGIKVVPSLETPFLTHLNLSHNDISVLNEDILSKSSLISLDVSHNQIPNLSSGLSSR